MDRLKMLQVFTQVVKHGSFTAAARTLHLSTTATSRHVRELENWLGVQLLHRTTRHLRLTDAGHAYLDRCKGILDEVENLRRSSREKTENPHGTLNITAPVFMGRRFLGPLLPGFLRQFPGIRLNIQLTDRYVNLIEEGFDVAIRVLRPPDANLASRELGTTHMVLVASPEYLQRHGTPMTVADLQAHNCIVDSAADYVDRWPLIEKGKSAQIRVGNNLSINNGELVREMALAGMGITLLPDFFVLQDVREGNLAIVLGNAIDRATTISAVYPRGRYLSGTIRVFVEHLQANAGILQSA